MCFQPYHRPTASRTWRIGLSASPGSVFQSWVDAVLQLGHHQRRRLARPSARCGAAARWPAMAAAAFPRPRSAASGSYAAAARTCRVDGPLRAAPRSRPGSRASRPAAVVSMIKRPTVDFRHRRPPRGIAALFVLRRPGPETDTPLLGGQDYLAEFHIHLFVRQLHATQRRVERQSFPVKIRLLQSLTVQYDE